VNPKGALILASPSQNLLQMMLFLFLRFMHAADIAWLARRLYDLETVLETIW
jgi:hypothetical protein